MININFRGVMVATQAALKHMNRGGRIITIGSCVGERTLTPGLAAYAATKGAVKMFTQGLAREVGDRGITVNNVQPGPIDTDLNPAAGDWATPQIAEHGPEALRPRRRHRRHGRVRGRPRGVVHHRREPDRGRRDQRLTVVGGEGETTEPSGSAAGSFRATEPAAEPLGSVRSRGTATG